MGVGGMGGAGGGEGKTPLVYLLRRKMCWSAELGALRGEGGRVLG